MPSVNRNAGREPDVARQGLAVLATLIGDAEADVQKALSWAYRSMALVDLDATTRALETEAAVATETQDGHRAWVIRDSLAKLDPGRCDPHPRAAGDGPAKAECAVDVEGRGAREPLRRHGPRATDAGATPRVTTARMTTADTRRSTGR